MASTEGSKYQLDTTGAADQQVRALIAKAAARGEQDEIVAALAAIARKLTTQPQKWGDPEHRTRMKGGWVYHGIEPPLYVRYVVYEPRKVVWLLQVRAMPGSPLAE